MCEREREDKAEKRRERERERESVREREREMMPAKVISNAEEKKFVTEIPVKNLLIDYCENRHLLKIRKNNFPLSTSFCFLTEAVI